MKKLTMLAAVTALMTSSVAYAASDYCCYVEAASHKYSETPASIGAEVSQSMATLTFGGRVFPVMDLEGYIGSGIGDEAIETEAGVQTYEVTSVVGLNLKVTFPIAESWNFYTKAGMYGMDSKVNGSSGDLEFNPMFTAGGELNFFRKTYIGAGYSFYGSETDASSFNVLIGTRF